MPNKKYVNTKKKKITRREWEIYETNTFYLDDDYYQTIRPPNTRGD